MRKLLALAVILAATSGCASGIERVTVQRYIDTYEDYTRKGIDAEAGFSDSQRAAMHMGLDDFRARLKAAE